MRRVVAVLITNVGYVKLAKLLLAIVAFVGGVGGVTIPHAAVFSVLPVMVRPSAAPGSIDSCWPSAGQLGDRH